MNQEVRKEVNWFLLIHLNYLCIKFYLHVEFKFASVLTVILVGYGRNKTINQSTGKYICFCDADDIMEPMRISSQLKLCIENPDAVS